MANSHRSEGFPSHVEALHMSEGDTKRHRTKCEHYCNNPKGYCHKYGGRCRGSAHCKHYCEIKHEPEESKPVNAETSSKNIAFTDIKDIPLKKLVLLGVDKNEAEKNAIEAMEFYKKEQVLGYPVVVECKNDRYYVSNHIDQYIAAVKLRLDSVPCEMGTDKEISDRDMIRKKGTLVWDNNVKDVGVIIKCNARKVEIRYDSGQTRLYETITAVDKKILKAL